MTLTRDGDAAQPVDAGDGTPPRYVFPINGDTSSDEVKQLINTWADDHGYRMTPDDKRLNAIVKGLIRHAGQHGAPLCPCMPKEITGDAERDNPIACPCVFVHNDITVDGACKCKFFVSQEYHDSAAGTLAAMNDL
jgi:ferredoxin-thioredoxin reductase catalytic subunit